MTIKKIDLNIVGMTCASCSSRVEKSLNKKEGVEKAVVNLLGEKATIEYDSEKLSPKDLVQIIEKTGYEVPLITKTLLIEGMTCSACSSRVEKVLNKLEGVDRGNVNLSTNKATVKYKSGIIEEEEILAAVEKAGYKAEVERERDLDREKERREKVSLFF